MTLRTKIIVFMVAFLAVALALGLGAFYLVETFGGNIEGLSERVERTFIITDTYAGVSSLSAATKGWAATFDPTYAASQRGASEDISLSFEELKRIRPEGVEIEVLSDEITELVALSDAVLAMPEGGDKEQLFSAIRVFDVQAATVADRIQNMHVSWMRRTTEEFSRGEVLRTHMKAYLVALVTVCLLMTAVLVIVMRRIFGEPYMELLVATERVAEGDLGFRIESRRRDEIGVIADRFDRMVESLDESTRRLRDKLNETELFLEITRIAGMKSELREAMRMMVQTISRRLEMDVSGVFLLAGSGKVFVLEACSVEELVNQVSLDSSSPFVGGIVGSLKPIVVSDVGDLDRIRAISPVLLLVPIVRDTMCVGIFVLGRRKKDAFSDDEIAGATILANTIGGAVRNIELYEAANKQLEHLRTVFELAESLTSVFVPDQILKTITSEVRRLINARGCIIRLMKDGMLNVESYTGDMELGEDDAMPLGRGIAGWAAKEGKSILVEDIEKLPPEMQHPVLAARSAIAVPLIREGVTIGTLGLYDKLDAAGGIESFTPDDLALAEGFASISAIAIDKMRMTEKAQLSEAEILKANRRMELLFESVQGGIITLDREYMVTSANRYIQKWIDMPLDQIIGRDAAGLFHGKGGICPHCAAKATFEYGDSNSITQASGLNYAELTSYPFRSESEEVTEAVVFIQDITERVLYQEEIMGLYREVMQTKEYNESLISNSADAIVTTDLQGVVKSWNAAAEVIYGFRKEEVIGKYFPFIPESLLNFEAENIERIKRGEVLKLETYRKRKDGSHIEVALTLSPIKDIAGDIIGISGISRDITHRKRVEKELIRRNQELSRLFFISSVMRGTLDLQRLMRMVLTAVTMSDGLGFNRTILFLVNEEQSLLRGVMGVGPANPEEAWRIWENLSAEQKSLRDIMHELEVRPPQGESLLDKLSAEIEVSLDDKHALVLAMKEKRSFNITGAATHPLADPVLISQLSTEAYAVVPLIAMDKVIGVIWVDNLFNKKPVTEEDMKFLEGFADQVASAIEAARLFQKVSLAEAELENIFRSISDMVFITDRNYTIKSVNQAVLDRVGKKREDIIGRKCYVIFHGMDEPWPMCPHHKTIETLKPFVEEIEDPFLRGTFLTSTSPVFDTDNQFLGTVHVVRDISEIKTLQEKLQVSERMAALGEVAAKVAHEIRNPLVSIGGFAKRLESKLDGSLQEYAQIIVNEVRRLEAILKDILGFVKDVRMQRRIVDLNMVMSEVANLERENLAEKNNSLVLDLSNDPVWAFIDPDRMKEALLNIVANANEATDGGSVMIGTRRQGREAVVSVEDTGCGMQREDLVRIFDPFFTTRQTGTGLGLAIARRIVEEHDGQLYVHSTEPGKGSKFMIILPLKEVSDENIGG